MAKIKKFSERKSGTTEAKSSGNKFDYSISDDDDDDNVGVGVGDDDKSEDIQNSIKTNSKEQDENKGWLTKTKTRLFRFLAFQKLIFFLFFSLCAKANFNVAKVNQDCSIGLSLKSYPQ